MAEQKSVDVSSEEISSALSGGDVFTAAHPVVDQPPERFEPTAVPKESRFDILRKRQGAALSSKSLLWQTLGHPDGYKVGEIEPPKETEYPSDKELADLRDDEILTSGMLIPRKKRRRGGGEA